MHLVAGETERIDDGSAAVDLDQSPGDIVLISSADSELAAFAAAARRAPDGPSLRLVNFMRLGHPYSVDLFAEKTLAGAKLVVLRLIGGEGYWPYGLDVLRALARGGSLKLIVVSADGRWDETLQRHATLSEEDCRAFWSAAVAGGPANIDCALALLRHLIGHGERPGTAEPLPTAGLHRDTVREGGRPLALITFYRALIEGGSTEPVDQLVDALDARGIAARAVFATSLKQADAVAFIDRVVAETPPDIVINGTAFALGAPGRRAAPTVLDRPGRPVLQVVFAGTAREAWVSSARGLSPRDMIMNVVLPEVDGRILTRPISFKEELPRDPLTDSRIVAYRADPGRIAFVADQAAALVRLSGKTAAERRVAIVLSNYPGRDGRFGNAVGLDTGESTIRIAEAMRREGYRLGDFPKSGADLMAQLSAAEQAARPGEALGESETVLLPLADYCAFHDALPEALRLALAERWGAPQQDAAFMAGGFRLAIRRFGQVAIGVQPLRGFDLDQKAIYHDPLLPPPHHYLAFYAWLRLVFGADVLMQVGKHGNLEWLPGKAVGLSEECWPEAVLGPLPLVYPFIVNDPGEGAQAKRRSSAVIIDHLMPPLARAEAHGVFAELETLIDEYHLALGSDPRRRDDLERDILDRAARHGIDRDLRIGSDDPSQALRAIDAHLCDIKEMQIRDGLHVLGERPEGEPRIATLAAIARVPRSGSRSEDQSLVRALAADLGLADFDPLAPDRGADWSGPRPAELTDLDAAPWRTEGDTAERLEEQARRLIADALAGGFLPETAGQGTRAVVGWVRDELAPSLDRSGADEIAGVMAALTGRFVGPGPSGAPSRGRPDVLPTGRNFYAVDTRAVPTEAAWRIGRKAAEALVMRYLQDEGEWPRSIALTVWGTANMRTGGDDIAEALALIGCEPVWEAGTGRVTGFRVLTLSELKRPRVDVTLRISGLFRDAFPEQIDLLDSAIRAVAEREEPEDANPIAAAARREGDTARIFGSAPGAYGAGIESLMATGERDAGRLAAAFTASGAHAYGGGREGEGAHAAFEARLASTDAVVQNQDNREHDILDSDEYHQFQGGFALAAERLSGRAPRLYHGDHALGANPVIRPLGEEIGRVVRGRASNPRWIAGAMRHGWRGAAEIAATVDFLAGYAVTTHEVGDHHFEALFEAYLADETVADFVATANPPAFAAMIRRFDEAIDAGLWQPRRNSIMARLAELSGSLNQEQGTGA